MRRFVILLVAVFRLDFGLAKIHRLRHLHKPHRLCVEPPTLRDDLAAWMRESLEGVSGELDEEWAPPTAEPPICSRSPRAEGDTPVMQRAMCPWESRVDFDETREPKIVSEAVCLCRRSRGATGAFCLPIKREVPVLRRVSCDMHSGYWLYERSSQSITVGCHSVLPRTQRATSLTQHYRKKGSEAI
ncbi:Noggin family and Interleukin-17 family-containing protein [Trichostrongylus colubriformis]|uniref:Noggin family and Interleukin-17 family-containing protein n=1 Tax=Trichostrongylus colubriformis TaxID=6319 RepID=A0AAN8F7C9_TRICO